MKYTVYTMEEGGTVMARKKLTCRAMGMNCGFEVHDESETEIVAAIGDHIRRVHKIEVSDGLRQKARDLVRLEGE
jgi:predicted small metal-binding protein